MSVESDLFALLSSYADVTAIVGAGNAARIYPDALPLDEPLPAICYDVATTPIKTIHGPIAGRENTLTIACWAPSREAANALADAVELALASAGQDWDGRANSFDGETANFATTLTQSWLT